MALAMMRIGFAAVAAGVAIAGCDAGRLALEPRVEERHELVHPGAPHTAHVSEPALAVAPDGTPHLAWIRRDERGASVQSASFASGDAAPVRVDPAERPVAGSHQAPGLAVATGGRVHVSWSSPRRDEGASLFASDLVLATSSDGGRSFAAPLRLHEDEPGSRGFESIAADAGGAVIAAWIESDAGPGAATRVVRVVDGAAGLVTSLGEQTCPCCRIAVAVDAAGRAGVLWRDEFPGRVRDMVFARSRDGGLRFAPAGRVCEDGWALDACPHRGGALAFAPDDRALVAWYSEGSAGQPALWLATGNAGGFGAPTALHDGDGSLPDRVALAIGADGAGVVLWERQTPVRSEIAARAVVAGDRRLGPTLVLSRGVHASGPAVVASPSGGFVAAWNEEEFPALRTVLVNLALRSAP